MLSRIKGLFQGAFRIAAAIVIAISVLAVLWFAQDRARAAYAKHEVAPYETMKTWTKPLQHPLEMSLNAKTKLVDGQLYADYELKGWPSYMTEPTKAERNKQSFITFLFFDKDGFQLYEKRVGVLQFSLRVGDDGNPEGLDFQSIEPMTADTYSKFDHMALQWTLDTDPPAPQAAASSGPWDEYKKVFADPCAPSLSRAERLKRLAQYGTVRETGYNTYSVGAREIMFSTGSAEVISCR